MTSSHFRAKHLVKVHVWAGISMQGRTGICIFEGMRRPQYKEHYNFVTGIMDAPVYVSILQQTLLPFIESVYPDGHRFTQDNDSKHTSKMGKEFLEHNNITWWKTPPESPDINPIENLWHELKEYLRREIKPKTKDELVNGIVKFWGLVSSEKCREYIRHLDKVIPRVEQLQVIKHYTVFVFINYLFL